MINSNSTMKPKYGDMYQEDKNTENRLRAKQYKQENATKLLDKYGYFGGKRLLGVNSRGTEVWISFKATSDTIEIDCTDDMYSILPENGGQLAAERISWWLTRRNDRKLSFTYYNGDKSTLPTSNKRNGQVTENTLLHLQKIIDECERFTRNNQKPPRDIYRLLAWNIFNSTHSDSYTYPGTNWDFCADIQGYTSPEGYYFTGQI